jgi:hypothetical protein
MTTRTAQDVDIIPRFPILYNEHTNIHFCFTNSIIYSIIKFQRNKSNKYFAVKKGQMSLNITLEKQF